MKKNDISLYIHIPFCKVICNYCDFVKRVKQSDSVEKLYIKSLINEIIDRTINKNIKTIYIGGGTPSVLNLDNLKILLDFLNAYNPKEYTIEVNPDDITREFLTLLKNYKINRISMGVESFDDSILKYLGRIHDVNRAISAYNLLKAFGYYNINLDIIYGVTDKIDILENDLDKVLKLNPTHLSFYSLILEEKTRFYYEYVVNHNFSMIDDETSLKMGRLIERRLKENHYKRYEISNYAKIGYRSIHNLCYWNFENYIGVGINATSYIDNMLITNHSSLEKYLKTRLYTEEKLNKNDTISNSLIMGLRKTEGINVDKYNKRFDCDIFKLYPKINEYIDLKLFKFNGSMLKLSSKGLELLNQVLEIFV